MKISLESENPFVWQWDTRKRVVLEGYPEGTPVHFSNHNSREALVVLSRMDGDKLVADIPPELMQEPNDIAVYICDEYNTQHIFFVSVISRTKPESYVYEPVEVLRYERLAVKIPFDGGYNGKLLYVIDGVARPLIPGEGVEIVRQVDGSYALVACGGGAVAEHNASETAHPDIRRMLADKLAADELPEAIENALAQAKESGEFDGATPAFSIGTVTTLDAGSNATASITGTAEKPVLNLGIPQGQPGEGGGSGGGTGGSAVSDFTLVGEALLEEDTDTIVITLSKECEHIILAYLPYGSASVTNTSGLEGFLYPNPYAWKNKGGGYCMGVRLPRHRFDGNTVKYGCAYGEFIINGNLLVGKMRDHTSYLLNMDEPLTSNQGGKPDEYTYDLNTLKTKTADKLVSILLQVWNADWGAGTHIMVYGR